MKKIKNYLFVTIALCAFAATACSDDDKETIEPLTADSVKGDFGGTLTVGKGEPSSVVAVVDDRIAISDFPVDSIIKIAVPESNFSEAVVSLQKQEYAVEYTTGIFGLNLFIELNLSPLVFEVEYGGLPHEVNAVFYTDKRGNYNGMDNSLSFELLLQSVTLDGEDVHIPSTLKYDFDLLKK